MNSDTTVTVAGLASAVATVLMTVLVLAGVDLGSDAIVATLTGSVTTICTVVFGLVLPKS